jgi:HAD superfamily hydrolase (TIGR01509 family)
VLDADGVIFTEPDPVTTLLAPFVHERGGTTDLSAIIDVHRRAAEGQLTSRELWTALGVDGDPVELDAAYTARYRVNDGVQDLVASLAGRGIGVACIADEVAEWSALLRARFGFDVTIRPWVVSGETGARKPQPLPFEQVAARAGVSLANCLYLDDRHEHLDVARRLGMATVRFGAADPKANGRRPHRHAESFADLLTGPRVGTGGARER